MTTWILITTIMTIANVILAFTKTAQKIVEAINKICLIFAKREQSKYEKDKAIIQKAMNDCGFQPLNLVHGGPGCYSLISKIEKIRNYLLGNASFESLHTHLSLYHFDTSMMKFDFEYFWNAGNHFAKRKNLSKRLKKLSNLLSTSFQDTEITIKESNKNKILKLTRLILDELQRYQTFYELDTHNLLSSK